MNAHLEALRKKAVAEARAQLKDWISSFPKDVQDEVLASLDDPLPTIRHHSSKTMVRKSGKLYMPEKREKRKYVRRQDKLLNKALEDIERKKER